MKNSRPQIFDVGMLEVEHRCNAKYPARAQGILFVVYPVGIVDGHSLLSKHFQYFALVEMIKIRLVKFVVFVYVASVFFINLIMVV